MELDQNMIYQDYQKPEIFINPEEYYGKNIDVLKKIPLRKLLPKSFIKDLDPNFKSLCRGIKTNLREENYEIFGVTGYAGVGKSQLSAIKGCLIDEDFCFGKNINFIPSASEVERAYLGLKPYSYLQIDEASRSIHKHKWYEKTQQKLSTLYDTEREGHFLCTSLIMPRFQNFTENFRNFFIKYWINVICRGIAIVYIRDEDKDTKDPWNVDESIKMKKKVWGNKRVFERAVSDIIRTEQKTKNYLFYFKIPEIPKEVWSIYKVLKKQSRVKLKENAENFEVETHFEKLKRLRMERWRRIIPFYNEGKSNEEIAVELDCGVDTIKKNLKQILAYARVKGNESLGLKTFRQDTNNIFNLNKKDKSDGIPPSLDKI